MQGTMLGLLITSPQSSKRRRKQNVGWICTQRRYESEVLWPRTLAAQSDVYFAPTDDVDILRDIPDAGRSPDVGPS